MIGNGEFSMVLRSKRGGWMETCVLLFHGCETIL